MDQQSQLMHHILERLSGIECLLSQVHYKVFEAQMYGFDTLPAETKPDIFYNSFASANSGVMTLSSSQKRRKRYKRTQKAKSGNNGTGIGKIADAAGKFEEELLSLAGFAAGTTTDAAASLVVDVPFAASSSLVSVVNVANATSTQPIVVEDAILEEHVHIPVTPQQKEHVHIPAVQQQVRTPHAQGKVLNGHATVNVCAPRRAHFAPRRLRQTQTAVNDAAMGHVKFRVGRTTCVSCAQNLLVPCFCDDSLWLQCDHCAAIEESLIMKECRESEDSEEGEAVCDGSSGCYDDDDFGGEVLCDGSSGCYDDDDFDDFEG